jgi:hypothetical protein
MAERCPAMRGLCRVRATLLDSDGNVSAETNNSWVSKGLVTVGVATDVEAGETGTLKNGCGEKVSSFTDPDSLNRWNLTLTDAKQEMGLELMLLGGTPIMSGADIVGIAAPDQTDDAFEFPKVALEFWMKAYDGDDQDQTLPWVWFNWPGTFSWQPADIELGVDYIQPGYVGKSFKNELWGNGPYEDTGLTADQLGAVFNKALVAEEPPDAACGFAHIAPGS